MKKRLYILLIITFNLFLLTSCSRKQDGFFSNEILIEKGFPNLVNPCSSGYYTYSKNDYSEFFGILDSNVDFDEYSKNVYKSIYESQINTYVGYGINREGVAWWSYFVYCAKDTPKTYQSMVNPTYAFLYQINDKSYEIIIQNIIDDVEKKDYNFKISISNNPKFTIEETNQISGNSKLHIGEKIQLSLINEDNVIWSVEDETIAVIDQSGMLQGIKEGTTTIKATSTTMKYDKESILVITVYSLNQ